MKILRQLFLLLLLAVLLPLQACAFSYSAKPIEGWVVDAATKQPIEAANVVAHWVVNFGMEGGERANLMLMETVTDKAGRYSFPAWGPKALEGLPWGARMKSLSPELIFFKVGYWSWAVSNQTTGPQPGPGPLVRTSDWNGKTIELRNFEGSLQQYGSIISRVLTGVGYGGCNWKKIPRILVALDNENRRLQQLGVLSWPPTIRGFEANSAIDNCGSAVEFFKEYQK